jgi:hypothetical protein
MNSKTVTITSNIDSYCFLVFKVSGIKETIVRSESWGITFDWADSKASHCTLQEILMQNKERISHLSYKSSE